jgi:predicted transcriptional regulator
MKSLTDLTAADFMSRDVLRLPQDMEMREAAHQLRHAQISGAPVVDGQGRCVGVLSTADFVRQIEEVGIAAASSPALPLTCDFLHRQVEPDDTAVFLCRLSPGSCAFQREETNPDRMKRTVCSEPHCVPTDWQVVKVEKIAASPVHRYMTADPVTVAPDTPIDTVAQRMMDAHVHRVIVVDEQHRPIGIVSSIDIVAAVAAFARRP